ncbi:hypothetical protein WJX72_008171 [[Myrmecia] bisecta]|uniref:Septin-type G domain-containing protein n=1 Tax=[Myrmecia] bisecta TaxID=41462 RepID=A0AAW1R8X7_9CHLO
MSTSQQQPGRAAGQLALSTGSGSGSLSDTAVLAHQPQAPADAETTSTSGNGVPLATVSDILGPSRPRPTKQWRRKFVKIMVVGDAGLGKTTLIRSLLSVPGQHIPLHDGSETSHAQFRRDPESLCSTIEWKDEVDKVLWVYKVQDTPGYGDNLNVWDNICTMLAYVERQNEMWLAVEQDKRRAHDLSDLDDPRIDLCLFCIPAHRLRAVDLRFMVELGKVVPILPIITKADTMTIREAAAYRTEVYNKLQNPVTPGCKALSGVVGPVNVVPFDDATLERSGLRPQQHMPPFLVVCSNEVSQEKLAQEPPLFWPERTYPWGTSEAFNPEHSDLLLLRTLLLKEACEELSAAKRTRYQHWRTRRLSKRNFRRGFRRGILIPLFPIAAGFIAAAIMGISPKQVVQRLSQNISRDRQFEEQMAAPRRSTDHAEQLQHAKEFKAEAETVAAEAVMQEVAQPKPREKKPKFLGLF